MGVWKQPIAILSQSGLLTNMSEMKWDMWVMGKYSYTSAVFEVGSLVPHIMRTNGG